MQFEWLVVIIGVGIIGLELAVSVMQCRCKVIVIELAVIVMGCNVLLFV